MEYRIIADLMPPEGSEELDGLRQYGVTALLSEWLDRAATIKGPDGVEITPFGHDLYVHGAGVVIELLVDAPALSFAENGAEALLREIMERTELLDDWLLGKCEVTVTDAELAEAVEAFSDDDGSVATAASGPDESDIAAYRDRLARASARLRAFDATAFVPVDGSDGATDPAAPLDGDAALAAGALLECAASLTEELFMDVMALEQESQVIDDGEAEPTAADCDILLVLHDLPHHWHDRFDALFAKRFLIASSAVFARLTAATWTPPESTAEAMALHLLVEHAKTVLVDHAGLEDDAVEVMFAVFDGVAYADLEHRWIFWETGVADSEDGSDATTDAADAAATADPGLSAAHEWFRSSSAEIHPYLVDDLHGFGAG